MADETYEKIDDNTIKITTTREEVTTISISELKNRAIDTQSNLDYLATTTEERKLQLQAQLEILNKQILEAGKLGVQVPSDVPAEPTPDPV